MAGAKGVYRWPDLLDHCVKCGTGQSDSSYGRRGLCTTCDRVETLAGRIKQWEPIGRDVAKYTKSHSKRTKDNYWRRKKAGDVYKIVSQIGVTEASERLGASKKEIGKWMNGKDVPDKFRQKVKKLQKEIKSLTVKANADNREEEFFEYIKQPIIRLNGKTL